MVFGSSGAIGIDGGLADQRPWPQGKVQFAKHVFRCVFLDRKTPDATVCSIFRIPNGQISVGVNGQVDFDKIQKESGAIGIWAEDVDGERKLFLVYDLNPA